MSEVLILSQADIRRVLTMGDAIRGVEEAYVQKSTGKGCLFPLVCHVFEPEKADLDIKSGHLAGSGIYGLKLVSWFGDNEHKGLPALFGTTLLFDDATGAPILLSEWQPVGQTKVRRVVYTFDAIKNGGGPVETVRERETQISMFPQLKSPEPVHRQYAVCKWTDIYKEKIKEQFS